MATIRCGSGYSSQWYRQRRRNASCSSRLRFEVSTTIGGRVAVNVPSSGTVTDPSPSASSRSASNSSSARSISSMRSTGGRGPSYRTQRRIGRSTRNSSLNRSPSVQRLVLGLGEPDGQQLPLVVPVVERLARGQSLVALEPHQRGVERLRQHLRGRRLADARLTLEQQRQPQLEGEEDGGRQTLVGEVPVLVEPPAYVVGGRQLGGSRRPPRAGPGSPPRCPRRAGRRRRPAPGRRRRRRRPASRPPCHRAGR